MWSHVCVPADVRRFRPYHFVPMREIGTESIQQIICSDDNSEETPLISDNRSKRKKLKLRRKTKKTIHSEEGGLTASSAASNICTASVEQTVTNTECNSHFESADISCNSEDLHCNLNKAPDDSKVCYNDNNNGNLSDSPTKYCSLSLNASGVELDNESSISDRNERNDSDIYDNEMNSDASGTDSDISDDCDMDTDTAAKGELQNGQF